MTALDHFLIWSLSALCVFAAVGIVLVVAASRLPIAAVEPEPEPVDEGPVHHASNEMAAWHSHEGRHQLDGPTEPITVRRPVTAEHELVPTPVMGQGPFIVAEPMPDEPRWFSPERMRVSA